MQLQKSSYIVNIIENTLNHMDGRLINHGRRVSYYVYKILKKRNIYTTTQIRDICLLSLIHDIGAYKTEEVHNLISFETGAVWEHSIYGYLFVKHFSPLKHLAPALLFHHAGLKELEYLHLSYHEISQMIFIADRIDVLSLSKEMSWDAFLDSFYKLSGTLLEPSMLDLFFRGEGAIVEEDIKQEYPAEFIEILYNSDFTPDEVKDYMNMVVLSIEFRSPQTMNHTYALIETCRILGEKMGLTGEALEQLLIGALLHDLGKVGVPLDILESTGKLSVEEFEVMKTHITLTKKILAGNVCDVTLSIAANHHEKLDGSGYDAGIHGDKLSLRERIMAVGDIFSALCGKRSYKDSLPKERVLSIMFNMKDKGFIDPEVTDLVSECYEELEAGVENVTKRLDAIYTELWEEYELLLSMVDTLKQGLGKNELYIKDPLVF